MDRATEQAAFERGDPRNEAGSASAYSSVLSMHQPSNGPMQGAQAQHNQGPGIAASPHQASLPGQPQQPDPMQRRGVNEYLQKKYNQKFNNN